MKEFKQIIKPYYNLDVVQNLNDYKAYGALKITEVLSSALIHKGGLSPIQYDEHLTKRMQGDENLKFFMLTENNKVVAAAMGWTRGTISSPLPRLQIQSIAVRSELRGKGLFKKLIDGCLQWAGDNGYQGLDIEVGMKSLPKTAPLYLHTGCDPNEVLFAIDVGSEACKPTHAEKIKREKSVNNIVKVFGDYQVKSKL